MRRMGIGLGVGINRSNYAQGIFNAYSARVVADGGVVESGACVDAVSGILLNASLLLIPSGYKGGKLYAEIPTNGNGDLTWTRGGDAFRTNASGVIQRMPWNLLQYSAQFDNAYWGETNSTVTSNTTISPSGNQDADTFTDASASYGDVYAPAITITPNATYTVSVFIKKTTGALTYYPGIGLLLSGSANRQDYSIINTTTGQVVRDSSSNINSVTYSTQSVNDYWRVVITFTDNQLNNTLGFRMYPAISSNGTTISSAAQGSNVFWGAQLVEGTTAQTYLPTTDRLNFPRLSYMYGSCPAVLLEPQRTNLILNSNDMTLWTNNPSTMTKNVATSPDGSTNALSYNNASVCSTIVTAANGVYSFSLYVKQGTSASASIDMSDSSTGDVVTTFTFSSKSFSGTSAGGSWTSAVTSYVELTNGWFRITLTATKNAGPGIVHKIMPSGTGTTLVYGAQLEAGAYPTTYIPTTSATSTRVADSFSRNNIYTNGLISASGGTWFVELRGNLSLIADNAPSGFWLGTSSTGTISNGTLYFRQGGGSQRTNVWKYESGTATQLYTTTTDTTKIAIKWNGTTADIFENGTKVVSGTAFTATNMEFLTTSGVGRPFFIQNMALFNSPLTDAQCQTLTT